MNQHLMSSHYDFRIRPRTASEPCGPSWPSSEAHRSWRRSAGWSRKLACASPHTCICLLSPLANILAVVVDIVAVVVADILADVVADILGFKIIERLGYILSYFLWGKSWNDSPQSRRLVLFFWSVGKIIKKRLLLRGERQKTSTD